MASVSAPRDARQDEDAAGADRLAGGVDASRRDRASRGSSSAMRLASLTSGLSSPRWSSGVAQSSASGFSGGSISGQTTTRPGSFRRRASWTVGLGSADEAAMRRLGARRPRRPPASTTGAERNDRCSSRSAQA